eukprot:1818619-Rhodomonas_salina.1
MPLYKAKCRGGSCGVDSRPDFGENFAQSRTSRNWQLLLWLLHQQVILCNQYFAVTPGTRVP